MIRKVIPLLVLILSSSAMAQVGIGTKKPASAAQLDIVADKKGVLIPRVKLEQLTQYAPIVGEEVESLLVYHTGENNIKAGFYYWRDQTWVALLSGDAVIDRMNNTFTIGPNPTKNGEESLIITDTENHSVYLSLVAIATNSTFITNLVENQEFITKLGDNVDFINHITNNNEFIENIINELKGKYGNVQYNAVTNKFFYYDEQGNEHEIDWSSLNTVNVSFTLVNDHLVVTDSNNNSVSLAVEEIAKNSTFVTNLVENQEFITKLGDNIDFVNHITNNNEFIENIINKLEKKYGNVNYDAVNNTFFYYDEHGDKQEIDWSALNTVNVSFTLVNDHLVVTDSNNNSVSLAVEEIAKNSTFVTNLVENQEFITKLGDNIDFVNHITNNNEFIENIINKLEKKYGNVNYDAVNNTFFYYDEHGDKQEIDWSALNTVNVSFTLVNDHLVVTDSNNNSVSLAVEEIAKNSTFVTNLVDNQEFITKLGDNIDFVNHITNNNEFIENIINKLEKKYGNVNYDAVNNTFFYYDEHGDKQEIDWAALNTVNVSFTLVNDHLVVTDSNNNSVSLAVEEIAKNSTFVTNLVDNQEFITKLGDNIDFVNHITNNNEFIENIINELKGTYGNVGYNSTNNSFFYYDEDKNIVPISWDALGNTKIKHFVVSADFLTITDTEDNTFAVSIDDLGRIIAQNDVFVTELVDNQTFITELGDSNEFKTLIKTNSAQSSLKITDSTLNENEVKGGFVFNNGIDIQDIKFAETLTAMEKGANQTTGMIEYYFVDETMERDDVVVTITQDVITDFDKIIQDTRVINLLKQFISTATGDVSVVRDDNGDIVITTADDVFNLTAEIKSKETKTTLTPQKYGMYVYLDEVNGEYLEVHEEVERPGETYLRTYEATKYVYKNEASEDVEIKGSELFGSTGANSLETITSLTLEDNYAGIGKALVFQDEEKSKNPIYIKDIFEESETLTKLEAKLDTRELVYTDEKENATIISLDDLVQEPWYTGNGIQATKNDQDIYTMGWVGIGYTTKSSAPNERLRVNGSITATNSYYADYVFENYFDGFSSLKYDYTFKDLSSVDSYIKINRHLPGITPISELEKTATGYSFNVSELSIQLLEKTEELFLHVIEQKKELDQKTDEIQVLKTEVQDLTKRLEALEALLK
ncbi:hypothetical protein [Myroides sp. DW712]|uniref:hypothetical protein n=1 Tax=Myroides sp. DW712 TaxID=3389800 RepID=UPI00397C9155